MTLTIQPPPPPPTTTVQLAPGQRHLVVSTFPMWINRIVLTQAEAESLLAQLPAAIAKLSPPAEPSHSVRNAGY